MLTEGIDEETIKKQSYCYININCLFDSLSFIMVVVSCL